MVVSDAGENALSAIFDLQPMKELPMKKDPKLTPWFSAQIKPVRVGIYKVRHMLCNVQHEGYARWNGAYWGYLGNTVNEANCWHYAKSSQQNKKWCGLSEEPK